MYLGPAACAQHPCPSGRRLLEHADRPLGGGDHARKLLIERLVHLEMDAVVDRRRRQPPGRAVQLRIGRRVAPVKEVPGEHRELGNLVGP
jgi:hypothetical protein